MSKHCEFSSIEFKLYYCVYHVKLQHVVRYTICDMLSNWHTFAKQNQTLLKGLFKNKPFFLLCRRWFYRFLKIILFSSTLSQPPRWAGYTAKHPHYVKRQWGLYSVHIRTCTHRIYLFHIVTVSRKERRKRTREGERKERNIYIESCFIYYRYSIYNLSIPPHNNYIIHV